MSVIDETIRQERVHRVLEAARAWRKWRTCENSARSSWPEVNEVMDAIDALDAPRERYTAYDTGATQYEHWRWAVTDTAAGRSGEFDIALAYANSRGDAEKIAAALNAAERGGPK